MIDREESEFEIEKKNDLLDRLDEPEDDDEDFPKKTLDLE